MGIETAAVVGGGMALGAIGNYLGAREQRQGAEAAAEQQRALGQQASNIIGSAYSGAREELVQGSADQQRYLGNAASMFGNEADYMRGLGQTLDQRYAGQREAGDAALARLQAALLGGDMSGFTESPGYQFRMREGQKAIERAAAARGDFGSGSNLKALTEYGQGVASQEYGDYLQRLLGLQQVGAQATSQSAQTALASQGMRSALLGQQAGYMGQRGAVAGALGNNLANLLTGTRANQANALTGAGTQALQYQLAGNQAQADMWSNLGNTAQQAAMMYAMFGGSGTQTQPTMTDNRPVYQPAMGRQYGYQSAAPNALGGGAGSAPMQAGAPIPYTPQFPYGTLS